MAKTSGPLRAVKTTVKRARHVLVLHGPNLNLLGTREPTHYGTTTLAQINARLSRLAAEQGVQVSDFQSNAEADLIERIHASVGEGVDFIIINPAAFTHTSVALRDALTVAAAERAC